MEFSEATGNKKVSLEELSKEDLVKKCNNLLVIAKKAKQAKYEASEELKKYKENEAKLSSDVSALKEVVESFNKKQNEFAEVQNKHKLTEERNSELKKDYQKLEEKYASKIMDCSKLEETLQKLSDKLSNLEISNSEYKEKINDFKENYSKLDIENKFNAKKLKDCEQYEQELRKKLRASEEKYLKLEMTLKEFQGKYLEECRNYEELQETLAKLQNKFSSERCSSRSSDSLRPVYENQEYDEMVEKYNALVEKNKTNVLELDKLNMKLRSTENLVKEWTQKHNNLMDKYKNVPENWNEVLHEYEKLRKELAESKTSSQVPKHLESEYEKLSNDSKEISALNQLGTDKESLKNEVINLERPHNELTNKLNESMIQSNILMKDLIQCQESLTLARSQLDEEQKKNNEEQNKLKSLLNERDALFNEISAENEKLLNQLGLVQRSSDELKTNLNEITKKHDTLFQQFADNGTLLETVQEANQNYSAEIERLSLIVKDKEQELNTEKENYNVKVSEYQTLLLKLEENEKFLLDLKQKYESVTLEKNKLIEICESVKSTEEIFKQKIVQLNDELADLRKENEVADKRYKKMEQKLEESRSVAELLKKEMDGKCDEYDVFKKEMEFYKTANDRMKEEIAGKEKECSSLKSALDTSEKIIEKLKEELKSTTESLKLVEVNRKQLEQLIEERNAENKKLFFPLSDITLTDKEKYEQLLRKYTKDSEMIDSSSLIADLLQLGSKGKTVDKSTHIDESLNGRENELNAENESLKREVDATKKKIKENTEAFSKKEEQIRLKISSLRRDFEEIKSLRKIIAKEAQEGLASLHENYTESLNSVSKSIADVFYNLQNGHSELLHEMNEMNQVLKERGEVISKLEQMNENQHKDLLEARSKISHLELKLSEKTNKLKQVLDECEELKLYADRKENTIKEMEDEIWKLKNSDSQAEALSSSTLSRVDEAARLVDVEESFEERYSKLKVVAAKLKKKVSEQQKQLEDERNKAVAKSDEFQSRIANFQSQIKSYMNLQAEYDILQDILEEEKNETKSLRKRLETANENVDAKKEELEELRKEKEKLLSEKTSFDNIKKKLSAQIITLKASIEEEKRKQVKREKEIEKAEYERTLKEKKLDEEKEKHKATMALFEKQKMETKNLGVLKLEIAEYEKSVSDLEKKIALKDEDAKELKCLLENQTSQCKLYLEEITHLKSQLTKENERATEADLKLKKFNEESSSREFEFKEKLNEIVNLKIAVEDKTKEVEKVSLELAKISKEKLKIEEKCKSSEEQYSREISSLLDTVASFQDSLSQKDLELSELRKEFDGYKVRAQSVLRQSQKDLYQSKQRNVLEELEQLRSTSESLKSRLEESGIQMQKLVSENEVFQEEKTRLYRQIQELKNSLVEARTENQNLQLSNQKEAENYNEALKIQKIQSETLAHCFQKKVEELEANHHTQVEELIKENETLQKQFQKIVGCANETSLEKREYFDSKRTLAGFIPVKSDKEVLDVMLLEREECEGSESVDSASPQARNSTNLIPLDQLLNNPDHSDQLEEKKSSSQHVSFLSEKLDKSENKIKHLSVLLSEAETDCARLQHLNDVLKEEIRRNQRNMEREQHAQNFEYLKNVVLKFISLHSSDERIRLVPVLNTILKLSPEEENILTKAARGVVDQSNASRGWSSYLHIWPGIQ